MTMLAETPSSTAVRPERGGNPHLDGRLVRRIRAEFLEMPGLKLTLRQAAKVFGAESAVVNPLLEQLRAEGFLVRDSSGAFRRCTGLDDRRPASPPARDLLDAIAIELPCVVCEESYRVSLRKIQLSQLLMDEGCSVRHFADCPPAALFHLIDPAVVRDFEGAVRRIEAAAGGAGGHLAL